MMASSQLRLGGPSVGLSSRFMASPFAARPDGPRIARLLLIARFARSFGIFAGAGEGAERDRPDRRTRGERLHDRRAGARAQQRAGEHALLALARAGAEAGVALDLLDGA